MSSNNFVEIRCVECNLLFNKKKSEYKRRLKKCGNSVNFFCSRSCATKHRTRNYSEETRNKISIHLKTWQQEASKKAKEAKKEKYGEFHYYLSKAKHRSKFKQEWNSSDLTKGYLEELWKKQKGKCALSGIPIELYEEGNNDKFRLASLDRIDSSIGYVKGNVQFIATPLNWAKNDFSNNEFKDFLLEVSQSVHSTHTR